MALRFHFTIALASLALAFPMQCGGAVSAELPGKVFTPPPPEIPIALMVDLSSGQTLYAREPDRRFMPASITKVMTVFTAFEMIDAGEIKPEQLLLVNEKTFEQWRSVGSTMFLANKQRVSVDALLHGITTVSANDGAAVLAEGLAGSVPKWTDRMNAKAREIGMRNSHFGTPNGWMDEGRTFTTARDLATLADAMITRHPALYKRYFGHRTLKFNGFEQRNHDPVTGIVDGADGIKTGFTNQAGNGFLGSAERDGRRLVMVVAGSPNGRVMKPAARDFLEWGFASFTGHRLYPAGGKVGEAKVQDGAARWVDLVAVRPVGYDLPQGQTGRVSLAIRYEGPLRAPIDKGEQVGELIISVDGVRPSRVPLAAAEAVPQANGFQRLINGVAELF